MEVIKRSLVVDDVVCCASLDLVWLSILVTIITVHESCQVCLVQEVYRLALRSLLEVLSSCRWLGSLAV